MPRFATAKTAWILCWALLSFWFIRPLWVAEILPLNDLPNHLGRITALHYLNDPRWNLSQFYARSLGLVPYLGHFYPVHLMTYLFGTVTRANRVYMSIYIAAAPLCGLAFARALNRDPWLPMLLLPISVGVFFQWGFISFCVGTMLMLPTCALFYRLIDEPTLGRAIALMFCTVTLYLCHVLPWGAFGLYAGVLLILEIPARRWRSIAFAVPAMLPSVAVLAMGLVHAGDTGYIKHEKYLAQTDSPTKLLERSVRLLDLWQRQSIDEYIQLGLVAIVFFLLLTDRPKDAEPARTRLRLPLAFLLFMLLAFVAPYWIRQPFNWWMINIRFWMLVAAVGVFLPRGNIAGTRRVVLMLGLAVSTVIPYYMARHFRSFSARVMPLIKLIKRTPLGSTTLLLHQPASHGRNFDDWEMAPEMSHWREIYNYPLVYRGGYDPYLYDDGFPVKRIHELPAPIVESAANWGTPDTRRFDQYKHLEGWDYFIVKSEYADTLPADGSRLVDHEGDWQLHQNLQKTPVE